MEHTPVSLLQDDEVRCLRDGLFHLDCPTMTLSKGHGENHTIYTGPGYIRQDRDRHLVFTVYAKERPPLSTHVYNMGSTVLGAPLPADEYFSLSATDHKGRPWNAERLLPDVSEHYEGTGSICQGRIAKLTQLCGVEDEWAADYVTLEIPGGFHLPSNTPTVVDEVTVDRHRRSIRWNALSFQALGLDILLLTHATWLEVGLRSSGASIFEHPALRVQETLEFLLGTECQWLVMERRKGKEQSLAIWGESPARAQRSPYRPLRDNVSGAPEAFACLFEKYLAFISRSKQGIRHPLSASLRAVLSATRGTLDTQLLVIPVEIEGILRNWYGECGAPDRSDRDWLDKAEARMAEWTEAPDRIRKRLIDYLHNMRQVSAKDRLNDLRKNGLITNQHVKAWSGVRHPFAHGSRLSLDRADQFIGSISVLHDLLYRLVFNLIGYDGMYVDYSAPKWPVRAFTPVTLSPSDDLPLEQSNAVDPGESSSSE